MSVTSGFFNSLNGDRKYNAEQMSSLFNGIINDGVFENIGTAFAVTVNTKNIVNVGIGRAWFDSTWIYNDAILNLTLDDADTLLDRIDAIVFDIDHTDSVRAGSIIVVKGETAETPVNPTLLNEEHHKQYPIAYVYRTANATEIKQANITLKVGTDECPYITGILKTASIESMFLQWTDEWKQWFQSIKDNLDTDAAGHLQSEIDSTNSKLQSEIDSTNSKIDSTNSKIDSTNSKIDSTNSKIDEKLKITRATLTKGNTSLTIADSRLTSNSALNIYTSIYGVNPTYISISGTTVTLTFDAQSSNMEVGISVIN